MKDWKTVQLGEIIHNYFDGPHATPKESEEGAIFLGIKNVTEDGRLDLSTVRRIAEKDMKRWTKRVYPKYPDIVLSYEATLHRYAMIPEGFHGCLGRRMALIRSNEEKVDSRFLLQYMLSPLWRSEVESWILSGATVDRIPVGNLDRFKLKIPDLPTQQKIARLLSRYDDLIENNLRRIKLLEELARVTYEEWFVRGRFPEMESSSNNKTSLGEITKIGSSKRIFLDDYTEVGIPFYRGKEITLKSKNEPVSSGQFISNEKLTAISEKYGSPQEGDILITAVGTIGSVYMVKKSDVPFYFKDGNVLWLRPGSKGYSIYLYMFLSSVTFLQILHNNSIGSSQKALTIKALKAIEIGMPSRNAISQFDKMAKPIFASVEMMLSQNIYLREARDLLLPRLMAGVVDLDEMEEV